MLSDLKTALRPAIALTILFAVVLGLLYPALVTGIGQAVFPRQANGSLIRSGDRVVGSELIAQGFTSDGYFHPRPSAAGEGYEADNSYGSNLGPASRDLIERVEQDIAAKRTTTGAQVPPADLVTASASGLDPHISPEAALYQVERVAAARDMQSGAVRALVDSHIELPLLGFLGEPRVNVLTLNLALDRAATRP